MSAVIENDEPGAERASGNFRRLERDRVLSSMDDQGRHGAMGKPGCQVEIIEAAPNTLLHSADDAKGREVVRASGVGEVAGDTELEAALAVRIGVALARFNQAVTDRLLAGALEALVKHGVADDAIDVATVPGAFELPLCVQRMAATGRYDAIVCLGAVVRGETPHFEFVAGEAARGIADVARAHDVPIGFGVLTTETMEQALERAGGARGNKGYEAAVTALEMVQVLRAVLRF